MFKRYTAILLTAILVLTLIPCFSASAEATDGTIEKLEALGILAEGETAMLESDAPLTRGGFIRLMVHLSGIDPEVVVGSQYILPFGDVAQSDENYKFLCAAYEIGLAEGTAGAMFRPNDPVTPDMAAKLLVTVLGYKPLAELKGGYPAGYQSIANQLRLFAGCGTLTEVNGPAAAIMLENVLDAPIALETELGASYKIDSKPEHTLLQERFHIYQTEGVLDGTEFTTLLSGNSPVRQGFVTIGGSSYAVGNTKAADWFGYYVEGYYRDEQGEDRTLVYAAPKRNKNETLQIDAQYILSADARQLTYEDADGETETLDIAARASLIYNGKQTPFSADLLEADCGNLTLIDNNRDGAYDVLMMTAYRTIVVSAASARTHTVTDYLGGEAIQLDPESNEYRVNITKGGAPITVEGLAQWDVLSYAESPAKGTLLKTVLVSREKVTGTVNAVSPEDRKVEISGVEYDVAGSLLQTIKVGDEGSFFVDAFGRVVASSSARDVVYGFVKAGKTKSFDTYVLKIFTENKHWVELPLRNKLRLNGTANSSAAAAYKALARSDTDDTFVPQLITYRVNAEREISELNTAQDIAAGSKGEEAAIREGTFRKSLSLSSSAYRNYAGSMSFEAAFCVESAKIFMIPSNPANAPDDEFNVGGASLLMHDSNYTNVVAYDMDELHYAKACTVDRKTGGVDNNTNLQPFMVVTDINAAVDDFDETVYALRGPYQSGISTVYTENQEIVDSLKLRKGDVVQFGRNEKGSVNAISRQFSAADGFEQKGISGAVYASLTIIRGQVKSVSAEKGKVLIDFGSGQGLYRIGNAVYLYDPVRGRGTVGTASDIAEGDYLFLSARYLSGNTLVLFKEF